jgi:hypothetical protein
VLLNLQGIAGPGKRAMLDGLSGDLSPGDRGVAGDHGQARVKPAVVACFPGHVQGWLAQLLNPKP